MPSWGSSCVISAFEDSIKWKLKLFYMSCTFTGDVQTFLSCDYILKNIKLHTIYIVSGIVSYLLMILNMWENTHMLTNDIMPFCLRNVNWKMEPIHLSICVAEASTWTNSSWLPRVDWIVQAMIFTRGNAKHYVITKR